MTNVNLVIPDAHVSPNQNLDRFKALGNYVVETKPKSITFLGDFGTFDSVSRHEDRATIKGAQMPTLAADFAACKLALKLFFDPIKQLQERQRKNKEKIYKPVIAITFGNHEDRVEIFINKTPAFEHLIDVAFSMGFTDPSITGLNKVSVTPYKSYYKYDDFVFTHVPIDGAGKPITSMVGITRILGRSKYHMVYGHTHKFSMNNLPMLWNSNEVIYAIEAGCFLNDDVVEDYAVGSNTGWSYNIIELTSNGERKTPEVNLISIRKLMTYV